MIVFGSTLTIFYIAVAIVGITQAYVYMSHQFYALSGSSKRSGAMAFHEILVALGHVAGFLAGGYLAETSFGRRAIPYWFGFAVVIVSLGIQAAIWLRGRSRAVQLKE